MRQDIIDRADKARHTKGQTTLEGHIYTGRGSFAARLDGGFGGTVRYINAPWGEKDEIMIPASPSKRVG